MQQEYFSRYFQKLGILTFGGQFVKIYLNKRGKNMLMTKLNFLKNLGDTFKNATEIASLPYWESVNIIEYTKLLDKSLNHIEEERDEEFKKEAKANYKTVLRNKDPYECLKTALLIGDADGALGKIILKDGNPLYCYEYLKIFKPQNSKDFEQKIAQSKYLDFCLYCFENIQGMDKNILKDVAIEYIIARDPDEPRKYLQKFPEDSNLFKNIKEIVDEKTEKEALKEIVLKFNNEVNTNSLLNIYERKTGNYNFSSGDAWYAYLKCEQIVSQRNDIFFSDSFENLLDNFADTDLYKQIEKHPDYMVGSMLYVTSHFKKALDQAYSKNINYLSAISTQEQRKMYDPKGLDRYTAKKFFLFISNLKKVKTSQNIKKECAQIYQDWVENNIETIKSIELESENKQWEKDSWLDYKGLVSAVLQKLPTDGIVKTVKNMYSEDFKNQLIELLNKEGDKIIIQNSLLNEIVKLSNNDEDIIKNVNNYQSKIAKNLESMMNAKKYDFDKFFEFLKTLKKDDAKKIVNMFLNRPDKTSSQCYKLLYSHIDNIDNNKLATLAYDQVLETEKWDANLDNETVSILQEMTDENAKKEIVKKYLKVFKQNNRDKIYLSGEKKEIMKTEIEKVLKDIVKQWKNIKENIFE